MPQYFILYHHPRRPHAVGPYHDYADARETVLRERGLDLAIETLLPCDVSIIEAEPKDGRIGSCTVYPPEAG